MHASTDVLGVMHQLVQRRKHTTFYKDFVLIVTFADAWEALLLIQQSSSTGAYSAMLTL